MNITAAECFWMNPESHAAEIEKELKLVKPRKKSGATLIPSCRKSIGTFLCCIFCFFRKGKNALNFFNMQVKLVSSCNICCTIGSCAIYAFLCVCCGIYWVGTRLLSGRRTTRMLSIFLRAKVVPIMMHECMRWIRVPKLGTLLFLALVYHM